MNIEFQKKSDGFEASFKGKRYPVSFPNSAWQKLPEDFKDFYLDNFAFLKSVHLPFMFNEKEIQLNTSLPLLKNFFIKMQLIDIPATCYSEGTSPKPAMQKITNANFQFRSNKQRIIRSNIFNEKSAVIGFSFGKDSLLTLAVAKELGIKPYLVSSKEEGAPIENAYKEKLAKKLKQEFSLDIQTVCNKTMLLHDFHYFKIKSKYQYLLGHLMTEYAFLLLPFAYETNSKFMLFGNERSCNFFATDRYKNRCYPVFDQSAEWMLQLNQELAKFSNTQTSSFIEPINDLAILKILYERYPNLAKYQYSCFPDESKVVENERWCCNCSKCARLYIMLHAIGVNPKKVGMTKNMLEKDSKKYYSIFEKKGKKTLYDDIGVGKEEQMYAFYLAYKNGIKAPLIEEFKKRFLDEAKEREDGWHQEFFGVHGSLTIPIKLKSQIKSIYEEELK